MLAESSTPEKILVRIVLIPKVFKYQIPQELWGALEDVYDNGICYFKQKYNLLHIMKYCKTLLTVKQNNHKNVQTKCLRRKYSASSREKIPCTHRTVTPKRWRVPCGVHIFCCENMLKFKTPISDDHRVNPDKAIPLP